MGIFYTNLRPNKYICQFSAEAQDKCILREVCDINQSPTLTPPIGIRLQRYMDLKISVCGKDSIPLTYQRMIF